MDKKYKVLSNNTILFGISNLGAKVISFLLVPLYTWVLSTDDYGIVDLINSTVSLLIPILTLNIQDAVLRYALDREYNAKYVIGIGLKINCVSTLLLASMLLLLRKYSFISIGNNYILFFLCSYMFGALNNSLTMYLKAKNKIKVMVGGGVLQTLLLCILNIVFLLFLKMGINGYLLANIISVLITCVYYCWAGKMNRYVCLKRDDKLMNEMIGYSLPLIANSIAWWMNNASDRYIITLLCGVSINGIYSVASKIPMILSTVQSVFYNAWSISAITEFDKDDIDGFIGNTYTAYSYISVILCSLIILFNKFISKILYAREFYEAWQYVPFLLVATAFNGIALFEGCLFTAVKRTKDVSRTTIIGAMVNIMLNFVLIFFIGPIGAAFATMVGHIVTWGVRTRKMLNIVHIKVHWRMHLISYILLVVQSIIAIFDSTEKYQVTIMVLILVCEKDFLRKLFVKGSYI